jgi:hypothetical protein
MAAPSVDDLARSFERYLLAGNQSPRTVENLPGGAGRLQRPPRGHLQASA